MFTLTKYSAFKSARAIVAASICLAAPLVSSVPVFADNSGWSFDGHHFSNQKNHDSGPPNQGHPDRVGAVFYILLENHNFTNPLPILLLRLSYSAALPRRISTASSRPVTRTLAMSPMPRPIITSWRLRAATIPTSTLPNRITFGRRLNPISGSSMIMIRMAPVIVSRRSRHFWPPIPA